MHLELGRVEEQRALPSRVDLHHLAVVAGADEHGAVGRDALRPEDRRVGIGDRRERRAEQQPAVLSIDRFVTSPFRKSACVPTSQKRAPAAFTATPHANRQNATGSSRGQRSGHGSGGRRHAERRVSSRSSESVSVREPLTACSVGMSHSPSVARAERTKPLPLRSPSSTASTDGGSADSGSPLTTAPASRPSSLT